MGALVWIMVGLAIWHFTVWLPDNFYGGIVGALLRGAARLVPVRVDHPPRLDPGAERHQPADRPGSDPGHPDRARASAGGWACASSRRIPVQRPNMTKQA